MNPWYPQMSLIEFEEMKVHALSDNMRVCIIRSINQLDKIERFVTNHNGKIDAHRYYGLSMRMRFAKDKATFARKGDVVGLFSFFDDETIEDFEDLFDLSDDIACPDEIIPGGKSSLFLLSRQEADHWIHDSVDDATLMERYLWALRSIHGRNLSDEVNFYVRCGWWRIKIKNEEIGPIRRKDIVREIAQLEEKARQA